MAQGVSASAPGRGDYLGGRFVAVAEDRADGVIERASPRDYDDLVGRHLYREAAIDEAVAHARAAAPAWALTPLDERKALLLALKAELAARAADFAQLLVREIGKPRWEAESELQAALAKIDVTLSDGLALVAPREMGSPAQRYA
ncbi:MAG: astD, partial [Myxococcaceae bacterium]|nr:astD [Myxococcaceae bacterium]